LESATRMPIAGEPWIGVTILDCAFCKSNVLNWRRALL
jgi:hypothetical protein